MIQVKLFNLTFFGKRRKKKMLLISSSLETNRWKYLQYCFQFEEIIIKNERISFDHLKEFCAMMKKTRILKKLVYQHFFF